MVSFCEPVVVNNHDSFGITKGASAQKCDHSRTFLKNSSSWWIAEESIYVQLWQSTVLRIWIHQTTIVQNTSNRCQMLQKENMFASILRNNTAKHSGTWMNRVLTCRNLSLILIPLLTLTHLLTYCPLNDSMACLSLWCTGNSDLRGICSASSLQNLMLCLYFTNSN